MKLSHASHISQHFQSSKPKWRKRHHMLTQQDLLVAELKEIMTTINTSKEDRPKRVSLPHHLSDQTRSGFGFSQSPIIESELLHILHVYKWISLLINFGKLVSCSLSDSEILLFQCWLIILFFSYDRSRSFVRSSPLVLSSSSSATPFASRLTLPSKWLGSSQSRPLCSRVPLSPPS